MEWKGRVQLGRKEMKLGRTFVWYGKVKRPLNLQIPQQNFQLASSLVMGKIIILYQYGYA